MRLNKFIYVLLVFSIVCISAGEFKLPKYEKVILKNGITVYLMEHHEVPVINISVALKAGAIYDGNKYGLSNLTAGNLLCGTKSFSKSKIEQTFDFYGASINAYSAKETTRLNVSYLKKDESVLLPIFKEVLTSPVFEKKEFEKEKELAIAGLVQEKERPQSIINKYFDSFIFGNNPYSNPVTGTIPAVKNITVNDLKTFYKTYYVAENTVIAVVGDFNLSEMKKTITDLFEGWKTQSGPEIKIDNETKPFSENRVLLVNKDDATETSFQIGGYGIKRSNPDFVAVQVINTILGGRFTSWLNDELRVNSGLTYGARSSFSAYKNSGSFKASSYTRTATTEKAIDLAVEVLKRLHTKGIDTETLNSAKNYVNGQYPPNYETAGSLAGLLTDMYINDFDESFINDFQKNVEQLTVEKAKEIVSKYFPIENLQYVFVGKKDDIYNIAKKYGEVSIKEIKSDNIK